MNFRPLLLAAFALVIGAASFVFVMPRLTAPEPEPAVSEKPAPFYDIVVRGRLEPVAGVMRIGAFSDSASPTLGELLVDTGDRVTAGQLLARLGNQDALEAEVTAASAEVDLAQKKLAQAQHPYREGALAALKAAMAARKVDLNLAADQLKRTKSLPDNVRSEAEKVRDTGALAKAQADYAQAEATVQAMTDVSPVEVAVAEAEVRLAQAKLEATRKKAELALIRAPQNGQVIQIELRAGEPLAAGPVLQLADMEHVKVVAEVDERLIERIKLGGSAVIKVRGGSESTAATVTRIGNIVISTDRLPVDAATGRAGRFIEVELKPEDPAALPPVAGLELSVTFNNAAPSK